MDFNCTVLFNVCVWGGVWAALIQSVRRHQQIKNASLPGRRALSALLVSSLQAFPAEFQVTSLHNHTSQFLTVNLCVCIEHTYVKEMHSVLATHTHTHTLFAAFLWGTLTYTLDTEHLVLNPRFIGHSTCTPMTLDRASALSHPAPGLR